MSSSHKKVTYKYPIDENTDYLVPLQYDYHAPPSPESTDKAAVGVLASVYFPVSLVLYVGIAIAQLVIGLIYIGRCPVQEMIAVWMIVSGLSGILLLIIGLVMHVQMRKHPLPSFIYASSPRYPLGVRILLPILIFLLLFVAAWFIAGQVFVFGVKLSVEFFDPVLPEYCHANLYKAAYIIIFIDYFVFFLGIMLNVVSCVVPQDGSDDDSKGQKKKKSIERL